MDVSGSQQLKVLLPLIASWEGALTRAVGKGRNRKACAEQSLRCIVVKSYRLAQLYGQCVVASS